MNPANLLSQVQGGIIMGLGAALLLGIGALTLPEAYTTLDLNTLLLLSSGVTLTIAHRCVCGSGCVTTIQRCGVTGPPGAGMRNVSPHCIYTGWSIASAAASDSNSASTAAISVSVLFPARRMSRY